MNMMNRMVEGRAHRREIDMLLELTYVPAPFHRLRAYAHDSTQQTN